MEPLPSVALGRRLLSLCYEALLVAAVLFAAGLPYVLIENSLGLAHLRALFQTYLLAVAGIYLVWQWTHGGQTLPMKTWHIRVVTTAGGPLTVARASARYILAVVGLALAGVGLAWALLDREGQFLHDRLAGTRLVRA